MSRLNVDQIRTRTGTGSPAIREMPAFRGEATATQNLTSATTTKVQINTVSATNCFDTNSWFDTSNNRYVPQVAGYYQFKGAIYFSGTSQTVQFVGIHKNNERYGAGTLLRISTSSTSFINAVEFIYMNGTTDYVELYGSITGTSPAFNFASPFTSSFEGFLVRPD